MAVFIIEKKYQNGKTGETKVNADNIEILIEAEKKRRQALKNNIGIGCNILSIKDDKNTVLKSKSTMDKECDPNKTELII